MSSNFIKILAAVFVVLALIVGVVAYKKGSELAENSATVQQPQAAANAVPQTEVVVAIKLLPAGQPIDPASVKVMGLEVVPKDYYARIDDVSGRVPLVDIDPGTPLTPRLVKYNPVARQIPDGMKAVSLTLTDVIGVGGFVRPGDTVDVLLYLRDTDDISATQARILLKDTRVLAYHELLVDRPEGLREGENNEARSSRRQRTAVLAVADADTTRLMLGASMGELRLALHGTMAVTPDASGAAPGALPMTETALREAAAAKVPDQAYTAAQLGRIELPPAKRQRINAERVIVYRGSDVQTITP